MSMSRREILRSVPNAVMSGTLLALPPPASEESWMRCLLCGKEYKAMEAIVQYNEKDATYATLHHLFIHKGKVCNQSMPKKMRIGRKSPYYSNLMAGEAL